MSEEINLQRLHVIWKSCIKQRGVGISLVQELFCASFINWCWIFQRLLSDKKFFKIFCLCVSRLQN